MNQYLQMKTRVYFLVLVLSVFQLSCEDESVLTSQGPEEEMVQTVDLTNFSPAKEIVTADVLIKVFDESNEPVENASIRMLGSSFSTNQFGFVLVEGIEMDKEGTLIVAEKAGYFQGSRRFFPIDGNLAYANIQLMEAQEIGSFDSSNGGSVSSEEGLSINFQANTIVDPTGEPYDGVVSIAAKWIDPSSTAGALEMPGSLQGVNNDLDELALSSFSMAVVELNGDGQKLNLAPGSTAEVGFLIPPDLVANAPEQIPLWFFDDEFGIWVEEGEATKEGDQYVGEVAHFSFWNCDAPFELVQIEGRLLSTSGEALVSQLIQIQVVGSGIASTGYTDDKGYFSGKVPKDQLLVLSVPGCSSAAEFGPLSEDTNLGDFILEDVFEFETISGQVLDCNGAPVSNAIVSIETQISTYSTIADEMGQFFLTFLLCDSEPSLNVSAVNTELFLESEELVVTDFSQDLILSACDEVQNFVVELIDGVSVMATSTISGFASVTNANDLMLVQVRYGGPGQSAGNIAFGILNHTTFQGGEVTGISDTAESNTLPLQLHGFTSVTQFCYGANNFYSGINSFQVSRCWDNNGSSFCNPSEDINGNGVCDLGDCFECTNLELNITAFSWNPNVGFGGEGSVAGQITAVSDEFEGALTVNFETEISQ